MDATNEILSEIFERTLSLDEKVAQQAKQPFASRAMTLWEHMAGALDEIAANTRVLGRGVVAVPAQREADRGQARESTQKTRKRERKVGARAAERPIAKRVVSQDDGRKPRSQRGQRATRQEVVVPEVRPEISVSPVVEPKITVATTAPERMLPVPVQSATPATEEKSARSPRTRGPEGQRAEGQRKERTNAQSLDLLRDASSRAESRRDAEQNAEKTGTILGNIVSRVLQKGRELKNTEAYQNKDSKTRQMLGYAVFGPLYGVYREVEELAKEFKPLGGSKAKSSTTSESGGQRRTPEARPRDVQGRFLPRGSESLLREESRQTEIAEAELRARDAEERANEKRHKELVQAIRSIPGQDGKQSGTGDFPDFGRRKGRLGRALSRRGVLGTVAAGAGGALGLGGGLAGAAGGVLGLGGGLGEVAGSALGKVGASASGVLSMGGRAAGGLLRAAPVIGQIASLGMAAYDGFEGWSNKDLHKQAFGLGEGKEASFGQKASSAAASVLDMGGLTTGLLNFFGADVSVADIARNLHSVGAGVTDLLGLTEPEKPAVAAPVQPKQTGPQRAEAGGPAPSQSPVATQAIAPAAPPGALPIVQPSADSARQRAVSAPQQVQAAPQSQGPQSAAEQEAELRVAQTMAAMPVGPRDKFNPTPIPSQEEPKPIVVAVPAAEQSERKEALPPSPRVAEERARVREKAESEAAVDKSTIAKENTSTLAKILQFFSGQPEQQEGEKTQAAAIEQRVASRDAATALRTDPLAQAALKSSVDTLTVTIQEQNRLLGEWLIALLEGGVGGGGSGARGGAGGGGGGTAGAPSAGSAGGGYSAPGGSGSAPAATGQPQYGGTTPGSAGAAGAGGAGGKIGDTIAAYESGGKGVEAIGYDRNGGTSYGKWQLSSKQGSYEEWLQLLEKKGGEAAGIAQRLRAAGATNTGSRKGAHVDAYLREAAAHKELFEETQRESLLQHNYNPAMKRLKSSELQGMINGDAALQEMLFSTSVQHGGAGAASIFNSAYKQGMGREDFIRAVYAQRATKFGSSTAQVQAGVRARFKKEQDLILGMDRTVQGQAAAPGSAQAQQPGTAQAQRPGQPAPVSAVPARPGMGFAARSGLRLKENGSIDMSTVQGAGSIRTEGNVNLQDMDPETAARMAAFAQVHERITGEKLTVTEGYRSFAEQQAVRNKLGPGLSATPGKSNHGTGVAFDIKPGGVKAGGPNVKRLEQIYKQKGYDFDQVLQEHGLARPLLHAKNAENWHIEALDRKTQEMVRDRQNLNSGKRKGSEYLSAEERQLYTGARPAPEVQVTAQPQAQSAPPVMPQPQAQNVQPAQPQAQVQSAQPFMPQAPQAPQVPPSARILPQPMPRPMAQPVQPVQYQAPQVPSPAPVQMPVQGYAPGGTAKARADLSRWRDRGSRNINPGNVKGTGYLGQIGRDEKGHAQFATKEAGVAGIVDRLYRYNQQKRPGDSLSGKRTIRQIMDIYAPASDGNNTSAYAADIAKTLGIGVDQEIDFKRNPELLKPFVKAIMKNESPGRKAYSEQEIDKGIEIGVDSQRFGKEASRRKHAAYLSGQAGPAPVQQAAPMIPQQPVPQAFQPQQPPYMAPMQQSVPVSAGMPQTAAIPPVVTAQPQIQRTANGLLAAQSAAIASATQDAMNRGVRYKLSAKNSRTGQIDCSGWVQEASNQLFNSLNASGQEVFSKDARRAFNYGANNEGAAGIIRAVSQYSGQAPLTNEMLTPDQAREGMVIGVAKSGDKRVSGRYKGIGHIVQTFRDPQTGQLMVSESTSYDIQKKGRNGVMATPYEEWYNWNQKRGRKLYGADLMSMANKDAAATINPEAYQAQAANAPAAAQQGYPQQQAQQAPATLQGQVLGSPQIQGGFQRSGGFTGGAVQDTTQLSSILTGPGFFPQGQQGPTVVSALLGALGLPPQVAQILQQPASVLSGAAQVLQSPGSLLSQVLVPAQGTQGGLGGILSQVLGPLQSGIGTALSQVAQPVIASVSSGLSQILQPVSSAVTSGLSQVVQPIASSLGSGLSQVMQPLSSLGTGLSQAIQPVASAIGSGLSQVLQPMQGLFGAAQSPLGGQDISQMLFLPAVGQTAESPATQMAQAFAAQPESSVAQPAMAAGMPAPMPGSMLMHHTVDMPQMAAPSREPETPESIRDIDPGRGMSNAPAMDTRALLGVLERIEAAIVDGTRKAQISRDDHTSKDGAPSIDIGFDDIALQSMALDLS